MVQPDETHQDTAVSELVRILLIPAVAAAIVAVIADMLFHSTVVALVVFGAGYLFLMVVHALAIREKHKRRIGKY